MKTTLDPTIYQNRQKKLLSKLGYSASGVVLVFGFGSALGAGTKSHGALRYLTGWDSHEDQSLLILSHNQVYLLINSPFMLPVAKNLHSHLNIVCLGSSNWGDFLKTIIESNHETSVIGLEEAPQKIYQQIIVSLSSKTLKNAEKYLDQLRLIKEKESIALHENGALLCEKLFELLPEVLSKERPCFQSKLILEMEAKRLGADYCQTWLTVKDLADYPRYWPEETQNIPESGDQVILGIALTVDGHWAHGIRMGSMGPIKNKHKKIYNTVIAMIEAGADNLRPGNSLSLIENSMNDVLSDTYKSMGDTGPFIRFRNGHGLGMSYEDPIITDYFHQHYDKNSPSFKYQNPDLKIKPGMIFELHPNLFIPGVGGAAVGDMFVVGESSSKSMIRTSRKPFIVQAI